MAATYLRNLSQTSSQVGGSHQIGGSQIGDADNLIGGDVMDDRFLSEPKFREALLWFFHNYNANKSGQQTGLSDGSRTIDSSNNSYKQQLCHNLACNKAQITLNLDHLNAFGEMSRNDKIKRELQSIVYCLSLKPSVYLPYAEEAALQFYEEAVLSTYGTPEERIELLDIIPMNIKNIQIQLTCWITDNNYDNIIDKSSVVVDYRRIRELDALEVEKLVSVSGIVVQVKTKKHKAKKIQLRCTKCQNTLYLPVKAGFHGVALPKKCSGQMGGPQQEIQAGGNEKCPPNPFLIVPDACEYWDFQEIKLQEVPEDVPLGDMPKSITCLLNRTLVDVLQPGNRVTIIGVVCNREGKDSNGRTGKTGKDVGPNLNISYLQGLGFARGGENNSRLGPKLSSEEEDLFKSWASETNIQLKVAESIAPAICASSKDNINLVKMAVGCLLFGGSRKELPDGTKLRGDINVLLLGDPSTAKSQFLKFVSRVAPVCVYTSGKGSSAAGLTAAVMRDSSGGFVLEGGAMVLADGGIVCIDEFDKMRNDDRVAIHEAMEQQTISIAKAGITVVLNTRCSVLAAANPIYGSYDDQESTAEQIDFATSILSRFDLIFLIRDIHDAQRDFDLAKHVIRLHGSSINASVNNNSTMGGGGLGAVGGMKTAAASGNFVEPPINSDLLKKYIKFAKQRTDPRLSKAAAEKLQSAYIDIRQRMLADKLNSGSSSNINTLPITVRQLEAISRIAESFAKMELSDNVTAVHIDEAIRLFSAATLQANSNHKSVEIDENERELVKLAEEQVKNRVAIGSKVKRESILKFLMDQGISETIAKKTIHIMILRLTLEETSGAYKRLA